MSNIDGVISHIDDAKRFEHYTNAYLKLCEDIWSVRAVDIDWTKRHYDDACMHWFMSLQNLILWVHSE